MGFFRCCTLAAHDDFAASLTRRTAQSQEHQQTMNMIFRPIRISSITVLLLVSAVAASCSRDTTLLHVSHDSTRELFQEVNAAFVEYWRKETGENLVIRQSHGGSSKQARAVIDGLEADVVSLALAFDVDAIAERSGLLSSSWRERLPHNSAPYTSTIVFLVRHGNPKQILDWSDLVRDDVEVITPNPRTSGGARWNYLAIWSYARRLPRGTDSSARAFVGAVYGNVPVLDAAARGATTTFAERGIGDVLITWESEALLAAHRLDGGGLQVVIPSVSILAEPSVALVDAVVRRKGTERVAKRYLEFLYGADAQEIVARHHYRPRDVTVAERYRSRFPPIPMVTIEEIGGSWAEVHARHFADGGVFDQIHGLQR
jgi:sulfate/thiosulfate-binding protein